jgi:phospholipase C
MKTTVELADDVIHDRLPQVSWIVATEDGSEHPIRRARRRARRTRRACSRR